MAIVTLKFYDRNTRDNVIDVLVIRYLEHFKMDSLEWLLTLNVNDLFQTQPYKLFWMIFGMVKRMTRMNRYIFKIF